MSISHILEEGLLPDRTNSPLSAWERGEIPRPPPGIEWLHPRLKRSVRFTDIYSARRADEKHWNEAMCRGPEEADVGPSDEKEQSRSSAEWLLAAFRESIDRLQETLAAGPAGVVAPERESMTRIRPVRPPRSEAPLAAARPAELLRPEYAKGRLYFSCPCCRFPAALPRNFAGKKARCPRCYSAIRAPHPRKGLKARVFENDIEALLHPERFCDYRSAHRLIPWLGLRRPGFEPSFHTTGVAVLLGLICFFVPVLMHFSPRTVAATIPAGQIHTGGGHDLRERARRVVEQFLTAETVTAKAAFVKDPGRVASLMQDWYGRHPDQLCRIPSNLDASGAGYYANETEYRITDVVVTAPNEADQVFTVEHAPDGDRIEWESSVAYNSDFSNLFIAGSADQPPTIRVLACLDDYFNFSFPATGAHFCVRLHDPVTLEMLGHGYVPVDSSDASLIASSLNRSGPNDLRPLHLEVRPVEKTAETHQVEIVRLLESAWHGSRMAVTGGRKL